ncbi:hypothetical protein OG21DRAFT_1489630 [Imleria badia]|nr:hypothetical protein OG21DRAFT_1489630 [Imleria badia]
MASHRAQLISALLANALAFGYAEIDPEREPLKNLDTDMPVDLPDTHHQLFIGGGGEQSVSRERMLTVLRTAWEDHAFRQYTSEDEWIAGLTQHLENINLSRFQAVDGGGGSSARVDELKRHFESSIVDLRGNVQLCGMTCADCQLRCVKSRVHGGTHDCQSDHLCVHECDFCLALEPEEEEHRPCTMSAGHAGKHICVANQHLCGKACVFSGRHGCQDVCAKVIDHIDEGHLCAAPVHACGKVSICRSLDIFILKGYVHCSHVISLTYNWSTAVCILVLGRAEFQATLIIPSISAIPDFVPFSVSYANACVLIKITCMVLTRMRSISAEHLCTAFCAAPGICEIETAPQSIEATFTGRNETFQYTKYSQVAKRLKCVKSIPSGATTHKGPHNHSLDKKVVHFCEAKCENCDYFCTLPLEIEGRKFSANDDGAPMMCNLVCSAMGRHVHIDYCRADDEAACTGNELEHLTRRIQPDPDRAKDVLTHSLFWKRSSFKDPYSREEQANFAKCDAMCGGREHTADGGGAAIPSYCVLPLFHAPLNPNTARAGVGYISNDGHQFACRNPVVMQKAFHVIFVADRSGSMTWTDRRPLPNTPSTARISARSNNRYGAVLSSLHGFWTARAAAVAGSNAARRDAYSVVLFDQNVATPIVNDFASTPDQLLDTMLRFDTEGGTNFSLAIQQAQAIMEQSWSTERFPVIIFLSDGECSINDNIMQDLCRTAVRLGKAVSFHAVSFGPDGYSRYLRRMAEIARDAQNNAPRDHLAPAAATILSSYTEALDTIQLAETFLGIAESLRKPRGALMH